MSTTTIRPTHPKYPNAAPITHLIGCPASDQQVTYPMPPDLEAYRLDPPRLADGDGDAPKRAAMTVSHCCRCGAMAYAPEGR